MIKTTVDKLLFTLIDNEILTRSQAMAIAAQANTSEDYEAKVRAAQDLGVSLHFENIDNKLIKNDVVWIPNQAPVRSYRSNGCNSIW